MASEAFTSPRGSGLKAAVSGWTPTIAVLYFCELIPQATREALVVKSARPIAWVSFLALMGPWASVTAANSAPEPKPSEEDAPPVVNSPTLTWQFNGSLDKVREAMLAVLKEDGLSIKEESRGGTFVTDLVSFDTKKFGVDVSAPPPRANPAYPWLQSISVNNGRYGLEGKLVASGPETTRLDLRALIEVTAINTKKGAVTWVPRYSNGTIEHFYFSRLGLKLVPPPSTDGASR